MPLAITPTFRPWTHTSDDSYMYQLSLVVATATVSFTYIIPHTGLIIDPHFMIYLRYLYHVYTKQLSFPGGSITGMFYVTHIFLGRICAAQILHDTLKQRPVKSS